LEKLIYNKLISVFWHTNQPRRGTYLVHVIVLRNNCCWYIFTFASIIFW